MKRLSLAIVLFLLALPALAGLGRQPVLVSPSHPGSVDRAAADSDLLFGQTHHYAVTLRGNGEAVVYARLTVTNNGDTPLDRLSFQMPRMVPSEIVMFQQTGGYPYGCDLDGVACDRPLDTGSKSEAQSSVISPVPARSSYRKVEFSRAGDLYDLKLSQAVPVQQSVTVVVAYAGKGYVDNVLGVSSFDFETFKVDQRVSYSQVVIRVEPGHEVAGKGRVEYKDASVASVPESPGTLSADNLTRLTVIIDQPGNMVQTANDLAAGETLVVKGRYARSWWLLNLDRLLIGLAILAGLALAVWLLPRRLRSIKLPGMPAANVTPDSFWYPNYALAGLLSAGSVGLISLLIKAWNESAYRYQADAALSLLIGVIVLLALVLAMAGPLVLLARQRGWRSMLMALVWQFIWLIVLAVLYILLFPQTQGGGIQPAPYDARTLD